MSSRAVASIVVAGLVMLLIAGSFGWNEWRTYRMERIPVGASKADVIAALGKPDDDTGIAGTLRCGRMETNECWTWRLIGQNYLSVCFDKAGKVICHESFAIWT